MNQEKVTIIFAFLAIYLIWGSTYLFNKILLTEIPPFQLSGSRFVVAGVLIFAIAFLKKSKGKTTQLQVRNSVIAGFFFLTTGNGCLVWALQYIDSGYAALLISSQPLILLFMLYFMKNQKILLKSIVGIILGIFGIFLLTYSKGLVGEISWKGIGLVTISLFCWGYASIFVGSASLPKNQFLNSAYQMISAGISMIIISYLIGESLCDFTTLSANSLLCFFFLVIFGSIVAFTSFNYLLQKVSPEQVSTSTYVNPVVAMILGYFVLGETIPILGIFATVILLSGVYFINSARAIRKV